MTHLRWRKSSFSEGHSDTCVELAADPTGTPTSARATTRRSSYPRPPPRSARSCGPRGRGVRPARRLIAAVTITSPACSRPGGPRPRPCRSYRGA
ncbi:DUF397 domain-containing protein [Streptomyces malaysiensis subsp. malaysiensis]